MRLSGAQPRNPQFNWVSQRDSDASGQKHCSAVIWLVSQTILSGKTQYGRLKANAIHDISLVIENPTYNYEQSKETDKLHLSHQKEKTKLKNQKTEQY